MATLLPVPSRYSPFAYFRSPSQSLAHDRDLTEYYQKYYARQPGARAGRPGSGTGSEAPMQ